MPIKCKSTAGFTIVELLVAVAIITILSGVAYSVLNVNRQREVASDGVARANLQKTVQAVEAYRAAEGRYPTGANDPVLATYIANWPDGTPAGAVYTYATDAPRTSFGVIVPVSEGLNLKYRSEWGTIQECDDSDPGTTGCITSGAFCGDKICQKSESCAICPPDCGTCIEPPPP